MTAPIRTPATAMSAFTLATTAFISDLENASITINVKDQDASAARDNWEYAWGVKELWEGSADVFVTATAAAMLIVGNSVSLTWNTGATTYTGQVLITRGVHTSNNGTLQKQQISFKGQGPVTMA